MEDQRFAKLIQALRLLSAPPEQLRQLFPAFVHIPDELALELNHWLLFGPICVSQGLVSEEQLNQMKQIDALFEEFSGPEHPEFWTMEAVSSAPEWERARQQARSVLVGMGMPPEISRIEGITYVEGRE